MKELLPAPVLPEEKKEETKNSVDDIAKNVLGSIGSLFSSTNKEIDKK